jgi:hypothetical protein
MIPMITLSSLAHDSEQETADSASESPAPGSPHFYVNILNANVLSERTERYLEMELGGVPFTLRKGEYGEMVSYFHLYVSMKNRHEVLDELRRRGIIVTSVGPYTNFRDPEGRVIKLSEEKTIVS